MTICEERTPEGQAPLFSTFWGRQQKTWLEQPPGQGRQVDLSPASMRDETDRIVELERARALREKHQKTCR